MNNQIKIYTQTKTLKITKVSENKLVRDFLIILKKISLSLINAFLLTFIKNFDVF